jgi:predicted component of type VI protein secretion system
MAARLVWEAARGTMEFPLANTATVGREEDADIQIQEPLVSRLHARLERRGEAWFVIDLGSTNLTRVNGSVIREKELHPGDEVQFARARCRFLIGVAPDLPAPAPAPVAQKDEPVATDGETPGPMHAPTEEDRP